MAPIATPLAIIALHSLVQLQTPNPLDPSKQDFRLGEPIEQPTALVGKQDNGIWKWASEEFIFHVFLRHFLLFVKLLVGACIDGGCYQLVQQHNAFSTQSSTVWLIYPE
jgi:hypothetical protein